MPDTKRKYIDLITSRSKENSKAIKALFDQNLIGNCLSTLRQELDSFIRIIFLGRITDLSERERLMVQTLNGEKWTELTKNNKCRKITDRDMVEKSTEIKGYIEYVYKFGCAFIHLSDFHNYKVVNPFDKLNFSEQFNIKLYLYQYHGFPREKDLTIDNVSGLIPNIFEKISQNMACYFDAILNDEMIEM